MIKELDRIKTNKQLTLDSREVANMLIRSHSDVMKMIQGSGKNLGIIPILLKGNFPVSDYFIESSYKDNSGKENKCYLVTKMGCEMLGNKQQGEKGILFTAKYVDKFNKMEQTLKEQQPMLPTYSEALRQLADKIEENEKLESEKKELENEVFHKEDVIIGLVKNIDVSTKRQRITQIVKHNCKSNFAERYNMLYEEFNKKYHMDVRRRIVNAKERGELKKSVRPMEYICDYMNMTNELYEVACKLYENDTKALMNEMWGAISNSNSIECAVNE